MACSMRINMDYITPIRASLCFSALALVQGSWNGWLFSCDAKPKVGWFGAGLLSPVDPQYGMQACGSQIPFRVSIHGWLQETIHFKNPLQPKAFLGRGQQQGA